jgi:predicted Zn-dependent protease
VTDDAIDQAQAYFNAGNFGRSRETAVQALASRPDDPDLLRLAGRSTLEVEGGEEALQYLQRVVDLQPGDAGGWRDVAEALLDTGRLQDATAAFRQAAQLKPDDPTSLIDLAHAAWASGSTDEAVQALTQALERQPGNLGALRSLVAMHREAGRIDDALAAAKQIVDLQPDDVLGALDLADLELERGDPEEAARAYNRLRSLDDEDHEVYALHGMIRAEIARDDLRRALDLAIDATRVDRFGTTTDVLAFVVAEVFGRSDRPAPTREEAVELLAASLDEHRRLHAEAMEV